MPQARCGRCLAPHAGLAQVTRVGAVVFQAERRWRVLLRDIFRFGTAIVFSLSVLLGLLEVGQGRPPRVGRRVVCVVGVIGQSCPTVGAQAGTVFLAQRLER